MKAPGSAMWPRSRRWRVGLVFLPALLTGCGLSQSDGRPEGQRRLQTLVQMYTRYAAAHKGAPPTDEKALKTFIASMPGPEKEAMKITNVDELFVSPRDQQPFRVCYGLKTAGGVPGMPGGRGGGVPGMPGSAGAGRGAPSGPATSAVVAYEQTGSGGRRFVGFATGQVQEVGADEAQKLNLH